MSVAAAGDVKTFADYLRRLKNRTGRSYEALARRLSISASALHRYCSGQQVPPDYGVVERLARECGADRQELAELHHLWLRAVEASSQQTRPDPAGNPGAPDPEEPEPGTDGQPVSAPVPGRVRAVTARMVIVAAVAVLLVTGLVGWLVVGRGHDPSRPGAGPTGRTAVIEDTTVGSSTGTVEYTGSSWTVCGGCDVPTPNNSYRYAYVVGDSLTVRFHGSQLKVYSPAEPHGGVAQVTVDGKAAGTVNFCAETKANGLRWTSAPLDDADHVATFVISGATGCVEHVVGFDRAEVTTGAAGR